MKTNFTHISDGLESPTFPVGGDDAANVDGASRFRFFSSTAVPFFRGIAKSINNARVTQNVAPPKSELLAQRIADVLRDPPDFSSLEEAGSVFGAPLEKQIISPDFPVCSWLPFY